MLPVPRFLLTRMIPVHRKKGEVVFKQGDRGLDCMILVRGRISLHVKRSQQDDERSDEDGPLLSSCSPSPVHNRRGENGEISTIIEGSQEKAEAELLG